MKLQFPTLFAILSLASTSFAQDAYLKASNTDALDSFGHALDFDGDTLAVSAVEEASDANGVNGDEDDDSLNNAGAVYVYRTDGTSWTQEAYLKPHQTAAGQRFGWSLSLDGDTLAVGMPFDSGDGQDPNGAPFSGSVVVFERSPNGWAQSAFLKAPVVGLNDRFGISVDLDGDTLVVGASGEDSTATGGPANDGATDAGAAYVFERSGSAWTQTGFLKASNADGATINGLGDYFGEAVAVAGDRIVVGAPFEDSDALEVDGDMTSNAFVNSGAAYVFVRDANGWTQEAYLKPNNTQTTMNFGLSLGIDGGHVVVGAPFESSGSSGVNGTSSGGSVSLSGAAYLYKRSGSTWDFTDHFKASNSAVSSQFGRALAIENGVIAIGARNEDSNATGLNGDESNTLASNSGAAYVFTESVQGWSQFAYVKSTNTEASDAFGWALALEDEMLLASAVLEDSSATGVDGDQSDNGALQAGAAYVIDLDIVPTASVTVRNVPGNPQSYSAAPPIMGQAWDSTVDLTTTGHAMATIVGFLNPTNHTFSFGPTLLAGPAFPMGEIFASASAYGPLASFSFMIPNDPILVGLELSTQVFHHGGIRPFALSNALDIVIGD